MTYLVHGDARVAIEALQTKVAALESAPSTKDLRWYVPSDMTSIDEFNDGVLHSDWVRVDGTGAPAANVDWKEGGDALSLRQNGGDTAAVLHGMMRPLSGAGGAMAVGDAFVTCMTLNGRWAVNYIMGGIILSDGVTHGAGAQVHTLNYVATNGMLNNDARQSTNWTSGTGSAQRFMSSNTPLFVRLVMTATDTWRCDVSGDGVQWIIGAGTISRVLAPTHVGLLAASWGGTNNPSAVSYEFLRRMVI